MIMKKILLGLVMLLTTATMNAQIELQYVLEGDCIFHYEERVSMYGVDDLFFTKTDEKTYAYNKSDFSLYGVFDFGKSFVVSRNIFTTDNKLCFICENIEGIYPNKKSKVTIFNEDNEVIKIIQLNGVSEGCCFPIKCGDKYKLVIGEYIPNFDSETGNYLGSIQKTYIYSCPGNGETTTSVQNVPAKVKRNAYPNPASDLVTLPYDANGATSMKIYDMQGKLVERKFLDKNKQELQLNVKNYTSGMYFFEVNGESNSFIVE